MAKKKKVRYRSVHSVRHMSANISGMLTHTKKGKLTFIDDDNGRALSDGMARIELNKLQIMGHVLMKCSNDCYRFDPFKKGCLGHIKAILPNDETMDKIELEWALFKQGKRI